jgi:hypothetical protein
MLSFWKHRMLEKMKHALIECVYNSEEELLKYGVHIESFSFEVPNELKKLFSCASRFKSFMYFYYNLLVPINSKEVFTFTSIFYSKRYSFRSIKNPSYFSLIRDLEREIIHQPKLYASFRFNVYTSDLSPTQDHIKKITPLANVWIEKNKVDLITYELPFEIKYKVYYV